jgi:hypothetical protein
MWEQLMKRQLNWFLATLFVAMLSARAAVAVDTVVWTDWTDGAAGAPGFAEGVLNIEGTPVNVSYNGEVAFVQTSTGTDYWEPSGAYLSPTVTNRPTDRDIIALSTATAKTITFSEAIANPLFAVVSLNGNGYRFDRDFEILSFGQGYWGNGTLTKVDAGGGIYELIGSGEPHGVIEFQGTFSSISWTSLTNEFWNGFTIGVRGLAVPEPHSLALLAYQSAAHPMMNCRHAGCHCWLAEQCHFLLR